MILCIGTTPTAQRTLTFDRLRLNHVNRAAAVDDYASGKAVNVARVATLLGCDAVAGGFVGGPRGDLLRKQLTADRVRHDFVRVAAPTRLCTTVIDRAKNTVSELVEESHAVDAADWAKLRRVTARQLKSAAACVLSGSLPPGGDVDFYRDTIARAVAAEVPCVLDARGEPLRRALTVWGFVVKLNREELAATVGRPVRGDAGLRRAMAEARPPGGRIIVTMGGDGAVAFDDAGYWRIPAPPVAAVNPIGSGDAFAAGLAVAMERGLTPKDAYALAAACGAANALNPRAGHVSAADVERLRKRVKVTKWE